MTVPRTIRINRLVVEGIDPHQKAAFTAAFTAELTRLLREYPDSVPETRPGIRNAASPTDVGKCTAAVVHAKLVLAC